MWQGPSTGAWGQEDSQSCLVSQPSCKGELLIQQEALSRGHKQRVRGDTQVRGSGGGQERPLWNLYTMVLMTLREAEPL